MKKIILMMLCVFFSHAYAGIDDPNYSFSDRYDKKITVDPLMNKKVNPYNNGSSSQSDYINTGKYSASANRSVTVDGSKRTQNIKAGVTASRAELAKTIGDRLKNMGKLTKGLGKATVGGFLGSAALTGLLEGVGWVMDEGGKVTRTPDTPVNADSSLNKCWMGSGGQGCYSTPEFAAQYTSCLGQKATVYYNSGTMAYATCENGDLANVFSRDNPNYKPNSPPPEPTELTPQELEKALEKALSKNNDALAKAIGQAVKDAFQDSKLDEGIANPLPKRADDELKKEADKALQEELDPKVCVPRAGDLDGQCTNMSKSEADAQPELKCIRQPAISDMYCVYVEDPDAPPKTSTDNPNKVDPETGELPDACVWFDVHCKWLEWTKEDNLDDDTELDIKVPEKDNSNTEIRFSGMCPADKSISLGSPFNFEYKITYEPYCMVAEKIKAVVIAAGLWISVLIIAGIKGAD